MSVHVGYVGLVFVNGEERFSEVLDSAEAVQKWGESLGCHGGQIFKVDVKQGNEFKIEISPSEVTT